MIRKPCVNLFPHLRILYQILVLIYLNAIQTKIQIERKSRVMLGISRRRHGSLGIGRAILFRKAVHDLLLIGNAPVCGIQIHVDPFVIQKIVL